MKGDTKTLRDRELGERIGAQRDRVVLAATVDGRLEPVALRVPVRLSLLSAEDVAVSARNGVERQAGPHLFVHMDDGSAVVHVAQLCPVSRSLLRGMLDADGVDALDAWEGRRPAEVVA